MIMDDKDLYPKWRDDSCAIVARFPGRCDFCDLRIIAGRSMIQRRHGKWLHKRCAEKLYRECCATVAS
jgi:hypothetical protein